MNLFYSWLAMASRPRVRGLIQAMLLLSACLLGCRGARAQSHNLYNVFENMEGAPWSGVEQVARQQAEGSLGPVYRNIPRMTPFYKFFEGTFYPVADSTRLAIFSDDGCNVFINGQQVWSRLNRGQHLPALQQSLHPIPFQLVAGQRYDIRVEYSNTYYTGSLDADGATLFAYTYDENPYRPAVDWLVGSPISCAGIAWPLAGMPIRGATVGTLRAYAATDWDVLQRFAGGMTTSREVSDVCTYTWTATAGSFVTGNGVSTGTVGRGSSAAWRAPTVSVPTNVTVTLVVDDRNAANVGLGETGSRNDAARGTNDDPLRFSVNVRVNP